MIKRVKAPKRKVAGRGMSQAEFGRHVDLSQQRVQQMLAAGTIQLMANGRIDPDAARVLYIRSLRRSPGSEEQRRVAAARARQIELRNQKELGKLIDIEEVEVAIAEIMNALSAELSGVAAASTRDLEFREIIQGHVNGAIERCRSQLAELGSNAETGRPLSRKAEEEDEDAE